MKELSSPTPELCEQMAEKRNMRPFMIQRCSICGCPITIEFEKAGKAFYDYERRGLEVDALVVGLDTSCDCTSVQSQIAVKSFGWLTRHFEDNPLQWAEFCGILE